MPIVESRRRFLTSAAFAGAAGLAGIGTAVLGSGGPSIAAEPPPRKQRRRSPMVTVLLLHGRSQHRVRPQVSDRDAARLASHPQGNRPLRGRATASRSNGGRQRIY